MMSILIIGINLIFIGWVSFLIWKTDQQKIFWWALAFKLSCGISVGLLYRYYYPSGDTWTFFKESSIVLETLRNHPNQVFDFFWNDINPEKISSIDTRPRSVYFLKWISIITIFTHNNYWITSLYFSLFSFLGSWFFFKILIQRFPNLNMEAIVAILLMPSAVFWGSGIIKESLAMGFLFLLSGIFLEWYYTRNFLLPKLLCVLLSGWVLWNLKYYWLAIWLAVVIPLVLIRVLENRFIFFQQYPKWSWMGLLVITLGGISVFHPNFYFYRLFSVIEENYNAYLALSEPGDVIHFYNLKATFLSILINSPWALISGLFRPFIFEIGNALQAAVAVENLVLLILLGITIYRFREWARKMSLLPLAVLFYIIFLSVFLALSTPNFGTLARFKIGFTPFLWFLLLSLSGVFKRFKKISRNQQSALKL